MLRLHDERKPFRVFFFCLCISVFVCVTQAQTAVRVSPLVAKGPVPIVTVYITRAALRGLLDRETASKQSPI